jgi:DNA-binding NarL/FixJ family response regulator
MPVRVILFEDNEGLRQSLEMLLQETDDFQLAGSFPHCDDAVQKMEELYPALVIMDIDMPGIGGIEGVKAIKSAYPYVKSVMFTVFDDDSRIFECICAGADGYLLKNITPKKFIESLRDLMQGGALMSPFIAQKVFEHFRKSSMPTVQYNLTETEKQVLTLLVKGNSYKMIAAKQFVSIDTVKRHLQNIYHKLHVNCGTEAVAKALQHKIVKVD